MRKFEIKNRKKRKYTRKSEEISSFSFYKTASEMLPLLVMVIAFMSTMIISTPLRDSFTNISFTFELPRFSLTNPLLFFQTMLTDLTQIGFVTWSITLAFAKAISQSFTSTSTAVTNGTFSLVQLLQFSANLIGNILLFIIFETSRGIGFLTQFVTFITIAGFVFLNACFTFIAGFTIAIGQIIAAFTQVVVHQIIFIVTLAIHSVVIATIAVINFIAFIGKTIVTAIVSTTAFVWLQITRFVLAVVHIIEIPFRVLYAFWLLIKPYVDFFGKHVQMSGADFSNMFNSFYRLASVMTTQK